MAEGVGKATDGEFAGGVGSLAGRRDYAVDAGEIYEAGVIAGFEQRKKGARHANYAPEIDFEEPLEVLFGDLIEGAAESDACVVDEDVDAGMLGEDLRGESGNGGAIGDVEVMLANAQARCCGEFGGLSEWRFVDVREGEMAAAAREGDGDAAADAAGGSGDDRGAIR